MALQVDFELDGIIHRDCYVRIHKVRTNYEEYEFFENVDDEEHPEIAQRLTWKMRMDNVATAYIWSDKIARENRALQLHQFSFDFDYDLDSPRNIYQQAYDALKTADEFSGAIDV